MSWGSHWSAQECRNAKMGSTGTHSTAALREERKHATDTDDCWPKGVAQRLELLTASVILIWLHVGVGSSRTAWLNAQRLQRATADDVIASWLAVHSQLYFIFHSGRWPEVCNLARKLEFLLHRLDLTHIHLLIKLQTVLVIWKWGWTNPQPALKSFN